MPDEKEHGKACDNRAGQSCEIERRILPPAEMELRVDGDEKPRLVGYAARYNVFTDLGWFRERIKAGAFDDALKDSDVRCLKNHDPNLILGRTKSGTLSLESNTVGLKFEDQVPETNTGRDVLEEVRRGDISGCSFAFTVAEQTWKYFEDETPPERTIVKIGQLFDVGPVTYPAYPDTSVAARSLEAFRKQDPPPVATDPAKAEVPPGQQQDNATIPAGRQRDMRRKYRHCKRIIARNRPAEA